MRTYTRIERHPLRDMSEALLREVHAAAQVLHRETTPEDPYPPVEQLIGKARSLPAVVDVDVLLAGDDAVRIAGFCHLIQQDIDGYRHVAQLRLGVLPDHRRRGLGTRLLALAADVAEAGGRTLLMGSSRENVPAGAAFAQALGAELGQLQRVNRLDLATADRGLLQDWLAEGPRRAPGYSLVFVRGETPAELVERVVEVWQVMNTAPRDALQTGELKLTPALLGEMERAAKAAGRERWAYYAVEDATGRFVGLTDVHVSWAQPSHVHIGNTGVEPAHRGRALGKWLKAAITLKVLEEVAEARWLITSNAASNDAMLAINEQMGFRAAAATQLWQVPVGRVRQYLLDR